MILSKKLVLLAVTAGSILVGCGDGSSKNTLYFNNYTHADTEGFEFLKVVATEANYIQEAVGLVGNSALSSSLRGAYGELATQIHGLSHDQFVLTPAFENPAADSTATVQDLIASQEKIVAQFNRVLHNTNTEIADFAKENLPKVEQLLAETNAAK